MTQRGYHARFAFGRAIRASGGRHNIVGYVDHVDRGMIRGWAFDAGHPLSRLPLDVFYRGILLGAARTGGFRQDLLDREVGDGRHGFIFHLPPGLIDDVSPSDIDVIAAFPSAVRLTVLDKPSIGQATESHDDLDAHQSSASFFLPLIARLTNVPLPESIPTLVVAERPRIDRLFDPVGPSGWSHIADHLAVKHGQPRPSDDPRAFWRWYLNSYAAFKPSLHTPLSDRDIAQLQAFLHTSSTCDEGLEIATLDPALWPEFAWAALESRRLGIADCAISEATRASLSQVPWFARQRAFPLSRFMGDLKANHRILRPLRTHTSAQRQLVYALVMLFSVGEPHYLQYMPQRWLSRMLEDGGTRFETAQARHFGGAYLPKTRFEASVSRSGFDLVAGRYSGARYVGHRVQNGSTIVDGAPVDVQLIGPFRRSLGLAESCRRLAAALSRTGHSVHFVDYDIGFSSPTAEPEVGLGGARAARITILHLNAEELPEAIAFMPDTFSRSLVVGVPYWELNRPASVHRLGLGLIDEVWATSGYLREVFAQSCPTTHIGMCVDDRFTISKEEGRLFLKSIGVPHGGAAILTTGDALSWTQRKNLLGSIAAFEAAFVGDETVRLVVKTRNEDKPLSAAQTRDWARIVARCAADSRIVLIDAAWNDRDQKAALCGVDCLLSLHRAEGLGFDILDALHIGTPVVATGYSGNMDLCDAETAWLVDFSLKPVAPDEYVFVEEGHLWAEPDPESAAHALRAAVRDRPEAARKSANARQRAANSASLDAFAGRLKDLVNERLATLPPR